MKEWRWDRLIEHLRREGYFRQLFGVPRPVIVAASFLIPALSFPDDLGTLLTLIALTTVAVLQFALRRQPMPVWTQKAKMVCAVALVCTALFAMLLIWHFPRHLPALALVVLLQPACVMLAWAVLLPLDRFLKARIIRDAKAIREKNPDLIVIGITGSVGKTTTKELLGHLLADLHPLVTPAHVNTELGVAQWMIRELPRYRAMHTGKGILVVEMGAYRKGEIALMSSYVRQTIGVVTHVGDQHVALFGSLQALFEAKSELITHLPADGHAFLNGDNDQCRKMKDLSPCPVTLVGTGGHEDLEAFDIAETAHGLRFTIGGENYETSLHGTHNITNILLAIAVAKHLDLPYATIRTRLKSFQPPEKTFAVREERGVKILDDTYNSSPASFKAAIAWARTQPYEQKTLLAAGLIELGEAQAQTEKDVGEMARAVFDRAVFLDAQSAKNFAAGFGKPVTLLSEHPDRVAPSSLLVCVGRMPASAIQKLLPHA